MATRQTYTTRGHGAICGPGRLIRIRTGSQAQHSLAATASHHRLARRTSTRHHVQRTKQASMKARVMLRLSASRAQISWPVEEEACRGSDDVSASRCDAAREHRQRARAGRAALGMLIAPFDLRTGHVEVRLAVGRSSAGPRGGLARLKGLSRSRPSSDEIESLLHTVQSNQSNKARRAGKAARERCSPDASR